MSEKSKDTISACFRGLNVNDWRVLQNTREKYKLTWSQFIHQLAIYPELTEHALKLPPEIDEMTIVNIHTIHNLLPKWMDNLGESFEIVKSGKDIRDMPRFNEDDNKRALVIGAGPSLYRNNHLKILADQGFDGIIFAADRVLKDCLDVGVVPDYILTLDGSEKILNYIDYDIVDQYSDRICAIMCITTHPSVLKRWNGEIYFFSNSVDETTVPNVGHMLHLLFKKTELFTAGHASSIGWSVAHTIGCREIGLIGLDLSYPADVPKKETWYYDRYFKAFNGDIDKIESIYKTYHHTVFGTDCYYDPVFANYLLCSLAHFKTAFSVGSNIVNCTEGGAIESEDVISMTFADWLSQKQQK